MRIFRGRQIECLNIWYILFRSFIRSMMGELFYFPGKIMICLYNRYKIRSRLPNVGAKYYENLLDIRELYKCYMNNIKLQRKLYAIICNVIFF